MDPILNSCHKQESDTNSLDYITNIIFDQVLLKKAHSEPPQIFKDQTFVLFLMIYLTPRSNASGLIVMLSERTRTCRKLTQP